jgi:hypothetical protein
MLKSVLLLERKVLFLFFQVLRRNQKAPFQNKRVLRSKKKALSSKSKAHSSMPSANFRKPEGGSSKQNVVSEGVEGEGEVSWATREAVPATPFPVASRGNP